MANVDPELLAMREEYQDFGKPLGNWIKNNKDLLRKKIEKVKNPKEEKPRGRPKTKIKARNPRPAPGLATEDSPDISLSPAGLAESP